MTCEHVWRATETGRSGEYKTVIICIILSKRFTSRQLNRGRTGKRGCWLWIQGSVCNLFLICDYLTPLYRCSKVDVVDLLKGVKDVLWDRSMHGCVVWFGYFNTHFPRVHQNIIDSHAYRQGQKKMWQWVKDLINIFEANDLCVPSTCFRPKTEEASKLHHVTWGSRQS